jgi:chromosome segregation ATPase
MIETLENALQGVRRDMAQLESARDWAAISRARMAEQQQVSERLQRELDATKTALSSAEAENDQLRSKAEGADKSLLQLEAKARCWSFGSEFPRMLTILCSVV